MKTQRFVRTPLAVLIMMTFQTNGKRRLSTVWQILKFLRG